MNKIKIAINGFGRIGRGVARLALERERVELVAINSRSATEDLAHLFKYDSIYGRLTFPLKTKGDQFLVKNQKIQVFHESEPEKIPWEKIGIDYVIEATGVFRTGETAKKHLRGSIKRVIITAPAKDEDLTMVLGVNEKEYDPQKHFIISNASCTTNCFAPVAKVLHEAFGIKKGMMTTVHAYTSDQMLHDKTHKKCPRRARAANLNMVPTTTGASKAVGIVLPELNGKLSGLAIRVPIITVSMIDFVAELSQKVTEEKVNQAFVNAAQKELKGILAFEKDPLVSSDFIGSSYSAIVDGPLTKVTEDNLVKVIAWYDNEYGYNCRTLDLVEYMGKKES